MVHLREAAEAPEALTLTLMIWEIYSEIYSETFSEAEEAEEHLILL